MIRLRRANGATENIRNSYKVLYALFIFQFLSSITCIELYSANYPNWLEANSAVSISKLKKGDILKVHRSLGYWHFGIYAGQGKVIHFSTPKGDSLEMNPWEADIIEVPIQDFANGDDIVVDKESAAKYSSGKIVRRARSRINKEKGNYNPITYNCEHFARWCRTGEKTSYQVEAIKGLLYKLHDKIY